VVRRLLALASTAALLAALGVAVSTAGAAASHSSISFSSKSATLSFTEQTVVPTAGTATGTGATSGGATNGGDSAGDGGKPGLSALSPKGDLHRSANHASGGIQVNGSAAAATATTATAAATSSFAGQASSPKTCSYFPHGCNPPDMALAAGPAFVLQGVNTQFAVYNTSGAIQPGWPVSAQNFFGVASEPNNCDPGSNNQPFLSDPRAAYDATTGRYWASMLQVEDALGIAPNCPFTSLIWVAVSQTGDPSGAWNVYAFNTSIQAGFANDYDQLAVNGQGAYLSANMFQLDSNGNVTGFYAELFAADKAKMEAGRTDFTANAFYDLLAFGPGTRKFGGFVADTVQPTMNLDSSAGSAETFVDTVDGPDLNNGHLCGFQPARDQPHPDRHVRAHQPIPARAATDPTELRAVRRLAGPAHHRDARDPQRRALWDLGHCDPERKRHRPWHRVGPGRPEQQLGHHRLLQLLRRRLGDVRRRDAGRAGQRDHGLRPHEQHDIPRDPLHHQVRRRELQRPGRAPEGRRVVLPAGALRHFGHSRLSLG
jgi:hypothetical protein